MLLWCHKPQVASQCFTKIVATCIILGGYFCWWSL